MPHNDEHRAGGGRGGRGGPRRGLRRSLLGVVAVAAVLAVVAATGAFSGGGGVASASPTALWSSTPAAAGAGGQAAPTVPLPADCTPTDNPPPTEFGFVAKLTSGKIVGPSVSIDPLTAHICGLIVIVGGNDPGCPAEGQLRVPADGVIFPDDLKATINVIPGLHPQVPVTAHSHAVVTNLSCKGSSVNGLKVDLPLTVDGGAGAFGLSCKLTVHGIAHSVVTGPLFSGNFRASIHLTGTHFHATGVTNNDKFCPGSLPNTVDEITQLPSNDFNLSMSGTVAIYQAG